MEMGLSIADGKIIDLPGLGEGLKFMYLALAEGESFNGAALTLDDLSALVDEMKSIIGTEVSDATIDNDAHNTLFSDLTESTVIDKEEPFALIVIATDENANENNERCVYSIFAEIMGGSQPPSQEHVTINFFLDGEHIAEHGIPKGAPVEEYPDVNKNGFIFLGWATTDGDADSIVPPDTIFEEDTDLYAIFEEDPNAGEVENPIVEMGAAVVDGKIVDLPELSEGLQFVYVVLAEGDTFEGTTLTRSDLETLVENVNSSIGMDISQISVGADEYDSLYLPLTDSTVIDLEGEFALVVLAVDEKADENGERSVYGIFADIVENISEGGGAPGEVENPIVEMTASVTNGKIVGLPGLGDGLQFIYLTLAEGDTLEGTVLTKTDLATIVENVNSNIGMDITQVSVGPEEYDSLYLPLTDSTVIDLEGEFALVVMAVDEDADENGQRRVFGIYADLVKNTVTAPGEVEIDAPNNNTGGAKLNNSVDELMEIIPFTEEELEAIEQGADVTIQLTVTDISKTVSDTDKKLISTKTGGYAVGMYFDASMFMQIGDNEVTRLTNMNENKYVTITLTLPDSLINTDKNLFRDYRVIRVHEGKADIITPKFDAATKTLSFETDRFSTYAITYKDSDVPKTGDTNALFVWSAALTVSAIGLILVNKKRKSN